MVEGGGVGGQTAIFHSASQFDDQGLEVTQLLLERGADPAIPANIPGQHDDPGDFIEGNPLAYASRFPGEDERHGGRFANRKTLALLREAKRILADDNSTDHPSTFRVAAEECFPSEFSANRT